jgi:non-ribosomal peptide synthetase component E (peptide arylation enzyme)
MLSLMRIWELIVLQAFAGTGTALQRPDGYFRIPGRVDDVINVVGHRLGAKELESSALMVEEVAEAALSWSSMSAAGRSRCMSRSSRPLPRARRSRQRSGRQ